MVLNSLQTDTTKKCLKSRLKISVDTLIQSQVCSCTSEGSKDTSVCSKHQKCKEYLKLGLLIHGNSLKLNDVCQKIY